MTGVYLLKDILNAGTYNATNGKPIIAELIPQVRNKNGKIDASTLTRDIELWLYNARIVLYDPTGLIRKALGIVKGLEDDESGDRYDFIVQALTYSDAKDIFNDVRNVLDTYVTSNPSAEYGDFRFDGDIQQEAGLGSFVYRFTVFASRAGQVVEVPS